VGQVEQTVASPGRHPPGIQPGGGGFGAPGQYPRRAGVQIVGQRSAITPAQTAIDGDGLGTYPVEGAADRVRHLQPGCHGTNYYQRRGRAATG
jgi:hypothetical protein